MAGRSFAIRHKFKLRANDPGPFRRSILNMRDERFVAMLSRPVDPCRLVLEGAEDMIRVIFHNKVGDGIARIYSP